MFIEQILVDAVRLILLHDLTKRKRRLFRFIPGFLVAELECVELNVHPGTCSELRLEGGVHGFPELGLQAMVKEKAIV